MAATISDPRWHQASATSYLLGGIAQGVAVPMMMLSSHRVIFRLGVPGSGCVDLKRSHSRQANQPTWERWGFAVLLLLLE
jgi:hypothetical protein